MRLICSAVAIVACSSFASAQQARFEITPQTNSNFTVAAELPGVGSLLHGPARSVAGDTFGAGVTVFSEIEGGFLFDASDTPHTFMTDPDPGALAFAGSLGFNFAGTEGFVFTNASPSITPGAIDITVQWVGLDASSNLATILPAGTNIDGDPITVIGFELGGPNVLNDVLESIDPTLTASAVLSNNFILFDRDGVALFNNAVDPAAFSLASGGLESFVRIGAGGADLGDFEIAGGQLDITIQFVPAPGFSAIAGVLGLCGLRRRR